MTRAVLALSFAVAAVAQLYPYLQLIDAALIGALR